jgi:hypothetical protein
MMGPKDFEKHAEELLKEFQQSYQYYLAGFEKGWIYNLADPSTKPQTEDLDLTEAKEFLSKFTVSGKVA